VRLDANHPSLRLLSGNVAGNLAHLGNDPAMARFLNTADIIAFAHTGNPVNDVAPVISPDLTCLGLCSHPHAARHEGVAIYIKHWLRRYVIMERVDRESGILWVRIRLPNGESDIFLGAV
jgi:hypothetical protein